MNEVTVGTFTITNLCMYGVDISTLMWTVGVNVVTIGGNRSISMGINDFFSSIRVD